MSDTRRAIPLPAKNSKSPSGAQPGGAPAARRPYTGRTLTKRQKQTLSIKCNQAYEFQDKLGLVEIDAPTATARLKQWKAAQLMAAVGKDTLMECSNSDFRPIENHFHKLAGKTSDKKTGPASNRKPSAADTYESRQEVRVLILDALKEHERTVMRPESARDHLCADYARQKGGLITAAYVEKIATARFPGLFLKDLTTAKLKQLHYTVVNRITAREGRGSTRNRNKSQRKH